MLYDQNISYLFSLTRLNDITTNKIDYNIGSEMLKRGRIVSNNFGRLSIEDIK